MTEPLTAIAIAATIYFCPGGEQIDAHSKCENNTPPSAMVLNVLERTKEEVLVLNFSQNGKQIFSVLPNGSVRVADNYDINLLAKNFWRAIAFVYNESCPALAPLGSGATMW